MGHGVWGFLEDNILFVATIFFATGIYITIRRYANAKARPVPFDWPAVRISLKKLFTMFSC